MIFFNIYRTRRYYSVNVKCKLKFLIYLIFRELFVEFFSMKILPSVHLVSSILLDCYNRIKVLEK